MAGLYIHIPFCVQKCAYCDFVSFAGDTRANEYMEALQNELRAQKELMAFDTVYIGGGTPSFLPGSAIKALLGLVYGRYDIAPDAEVTIEANPCSLTPEKLEAYASAGVNRASLGVQSLSDALLHTLGRAHDGERARRAMELLRSFGLRWSADVMLSLPGQAQSDVQETLDEIIRFGPGHISAYPLILEENTPLLSAVESGALALPGEDEAYELERLAVDLLERAGYGRYEISSFAKPGEECRHNLNYWNNGAYAGLGLAAHGAHRTRDGQWARTENTGDFGEYFAGIPARVTLIPRKEEKFETIMLALRKTQGLCLADYAVRFSCSFLAEYADQIHECSLGGLLKIQDGYAFLTERGLSIQNKVLLRFL